MIVTTSEVAGECHRAALREAGSFAAVSPHHLLRALLEAPSCGFTRYLSALGVDLLRLSSLAASGRSAEDAGAAFAQLVRLSYEVVPEQRVAPQEGRTKVLHTVHCLWGFAADASGAGAMLREACRPLEALRRDSDLWTSWYDG
jgi:hypothetical protein